MDIQEQTNQHKTKKQNADNAVTSNTDLHACLMVIRDKKYQRSSAFANPLYPRSKIKLKTGKTILLLMIALWK